MEGTDVLSELKGMVVAVLVVVAASTAMSQSVQLVAGRLLFQPLLASQFEPRMGVEKALDKNFLTLNIGNSVDLLAWKNAGADSAAEIRAGADFFTWSHLQSNSDFRFPVEAVDYLFGLNASWVSGALPDRWEARFRLAHISAHAVDGLYDINTHLWRTHEPFTYTREFVDLIAARAFEWNGFPVRVLAGGTLLLHSFPLVFAAFSPHIGYEVHGDPTGAIVPFMGYDGRLQRITAWHMSHALNAGVKFGGWSATGTQVYLAYEAGESAHGERYAIVEDHWLLGMNIVF